MINFFRRLSDERYLRARKRRRTEEIMGWICVPVLLMIGWFGWQAWQETAPNRAAGQEPAISTTTILRR